MGGGRGGGHIVRGEAVEVDQAAGGWALASGDVSGEENGPTHSWLRCDVAPRLA